jgi:hypothetical protein
MVGKYGGFVNKARDFYMHACMYFLVLNWYISHYQQHIILIYCAFLKNEATTLWNGFVLAQTDRKLKMFRPYTIRTNSTDGKAFRGVDAGGVGYIASCESASCE